MKRLTFLIALLLACNTLFAQKNEFFKVNTGTRITDAIPFAERYQYPAFTKGRITLNDGRSNTCLFNLNLISGEMEFIQGKDTLFIAEKGDLSTIIIAKDTFYYQNAYLKLIRNGKLKVYMSQRLGVADVLKKGAMGTVNRSSASESYSYLDADKLTHFLTADEDMVFRRMVTFYYSMPDKEITMFNRKNSGKIISGKDEEIKEFLKTNEINFQSKEDILKLTEFINSRVSEKIN